MAGIPISCESYDDGIVSIWKYLADFFRRLIRWAEK